MPTRSDRSVGDIAIIGGGWYGCHLALTLRTLGVNVRLFEQSNRLLSAASGNNQCRLHMGFHYARHSVTRSQTRTGFQQFVKEYPGLSKPVQHNIYAVASQESLIDYGTYRLIMASSGVSFTESNAQDVVRLTNIAGAMCTPERVILQDKAREYFEAALSGVLELGTKVTDVQDTGEAILFNGFKFDYVIDATWGHFSPPSVEVIYEPTLLLYLQGPPNFPAITLVDGPLCSLYPTEIKSLYTLSSVPHTPLAKCRTPAEALAVCDSVDAQTVAKKRASMEKQIERYLPSFRQLFRYVGPQFSVKTKIVGSDDDRCCHVSRNGRLFCVMSGKIDTIFIATDQILQSLNLTKANKSEDFTDSPHL